MQLNKSNDSPLIDQPRMTFTNIKENICTNLYGDFNTCIIKKQLVTTHYLIT